MSSDKITEMLLQAFIRFLIPGIIFIVFVFLIPAYFINFLFENGDPIKPFFCGILSLVNIPTLFYISAISVGLLLDLSRFYSFLSIYIFSVRSKKIILK